MDRNLRASLIAGAAAAILSMLVGIVSGIGFWVLLVRALLGGLLFGGLVFGALFVIKRFLPELFSVEAVGEPEPGSSVDIVLPEEGPGSASEEPRIARKPREAADASADAIETEDFAYSSESLLDDEVTASPARPEESKASAKPSTAASVGAPSDAKSAAQFPRGEGLDDLDVLPDLESLTDGFISVQGGNRESSPPHQDYEDPEPRRRESGGSGQAADPAMLAQAVRTLLKRDQER